MIENFEQTKKQLSELASVINSFKSEAVQLKIIELILGRQSEVEEPLTRANPKPRKATKRPKPTRKKAKEPSGSRKNRSGGTGAVATLGELAAGDFFTQSRTIGDIIEHCKDNLARTFKANEFSGKLGRMVRNGELTRKKNKENQYEYKKP